jgi:hypothetical protein
LVGADTFLLGVLLGADAFFLLCVPSFTQEGPL